jgi:hypothetical protein
MSLGIEKLKPAIQHLAQLISASTKVDVNGNGIVDTSEIFGIVQVLVFKVIAIYGTLPAALAELKDVDSVERAELVKVFNENFDLSDDVVESLLEEWFVLIDQVITLSSKTVTKFSK